MRNVPGNSHSKPVAATSGFALATAAIVAAYLCVGSWFGYALYVSMPAVNLRGAAYVAATWPFHLKAVPIHAPIPRWAFTFKDEGAS